MWLAALAEHVQKCLGEVEISFLLTVTWNLVSSPFIFLSPIAAFFSFEAFHILTSGSLIWVDPSRCVSSGRIFHTVGWKGKQSGEDRVFLPLCRADILVSLSLA